MKRFPKPILFLGGAFFFLCFNLLLNLANFSPVKAQSPVELAQNSAAVSYFQTLAEADELYQQGEEQAAANLYRQVKPEFPQSQPAIVVDPIFEPEELDGGGAKLWRNALDGIEKNLESKIFTNLQRLTQNYPEFIPGHLKLVEVCEAQPEKCANYAQGGQPTNPAEVIERLANLYPDDPDVLRTKIDLLGKYGEKDYNYFLDASITARQFSLIFVDYPEAPEFSQLADEYLGRYKSKLNGELRNQGIASFGINLARGIMSGDLETAINQGVSGFQTLQMIIQGESAFGKAIADAQAEEFRKQGILVEDDELQQYVSGIAGRFTPYLGRDFEYEYYIVNDPNLNAFALPGGKVFVNTGAILGTRSEAELAGLLGHEVAHAALSHGYRRVAQSNLLASFQDLVPFGDLISEMATKQYSRNNERESDILGTRVLAASGYAADGLRNFMETLRQQTGNTPTDWRATHPAPVERVRYLERLIQDNGYDRYVYEGVKSHLAMQQKLEGGGAIPETAIATTPDNNTTTALTSDNNTTTSTPQPQQRTVGDVSLIARQMQDDVEIKLEGATVQRDGSFKVNLTITNNSTRFFAFSSLQAQVVDSEGNSINTQFPSLSVDKGSTTTGEIWILGRQWQENPQQDLTLVVKTGSRLFRIAF